MDLPVRLEAGTCGVWARMMIANNEKATTTSAGLMVPRTLLLCLQTMRVSLLMVGFLPGSEWMPRRGQWFKEFSSTVVRADLRQECRPPVSISAVSDGERNSHELRRHTY